MECCVLVFVLGFLPLTSLLDIPVSPHVYRMCSSSWFLYQGLSIGTEMLAYVSDDDTKDV